jgi:hypothetical protein
MRDLRLSRVVFHLVAFEFEYFKRASPLAFSAVGADFVDDRNPVFG